MHLKYWFSIMYCIYCFLLNLNLSILNIYFPWGGYIPMEFYHLTCISLVSSILKIFRTKGRVWPLKEWFQFL